MPFSAATRRPRRAPALACLTVAWGALAAAPAAAQEVVPTSAAVASSAPPSRGAGRAGATPPADATQGPAPAVGLTPAEPAAARTAWADDTPRRRLSPWKHVGVGLLAGALVGAAVGIPIDAGCRDCMVLATPFTAAAGALLGAATGGVVYGVRRAAGSR